MLDFVDSGHIALETHVEHYLMQVENLKSYSSVSCCAREDNVSRRQPPPHYYLSILSREKLALDHEPMCVQNSQNHSAF